MYRWHSLIGDFDFEDEAITFRGGVTRILDQPAPAIGNAVSDQRFSGGALRGTVRFREINDYSACQFIVSYQPATRAFVTAVGSPSFCVDERGDGVSHARGVASRSSTG